MKQPVKRWIRTSKPGILDPQTGDPDNRIIGDLSWERKEILPPRGIVVEGSLVDCLACSSTLLREIELELEHKYLKNELLAKQIGLHEKI